MRSSSSFVVAFLSIIAIGSGCGEQRPEAPVVVMTQNVGLGADLDAVLAASAADLPVRVDAMWADKDRSNFALRVGALAAGVAVQEPELIGVQSAAQWWRQVPASAAPADEPVADYLDLLVAALAARGLAYDPVAVVTTSDVEFSGATGNDYRVIDREVILAKRGLKTLDADGGTYEARRTIVIGGSTIEARRGWVSVWVEKNGKLFRFVSTRLEAVALDVQYAQTLELRSVATGTVATVLVGDLGPDSGPSWQLLAARESAFFDAVGAAGAGLPSCCRDAVCVDPAARLDRRTDFVLTTRHFQPSWGSWAHGNGTAMVGGLWPSPHAGILAGLWLD